MPPGHAANPQTRQDLARILTDILRRLERLERRIITVAQSGGD